MHCAKHHVFQMPNDLHHTHFIEHWIDQGDWLAAADALRTGFYLFLTLKTTLASLWSAICVSVCAAIWKEKAPVCLEVRSGVQYKCFGSSWTQRRTSGINSSRRKKNFFLQRVIDKEYVSFRELVSRNGVCEWARAQSSCVERTHRDSGACRPQSPQRNRHIFPLMFLFCGLQRWIWSLWLIW